MGSQIKFCPAPIFCLAAVLMHTRLLQIYCLSTTVAYSCSYDNSYLFSLTGKESKLMALFFPGLIKKYC